MVHPAGGDGTDPDSPTRNEVEGRRQAMPAIESVRLLLKRSFNLSL